MTGHLGEALIEQVAASLAAGDEQRRTDLLGMLAAGLEAADPAAAVERSLSEAAQGETGPVTVVAIGKAAANMTRGAVAAWKDRIEGGVVITTHPAPVPPGFSLMVSSHPTPDEKSLMAGRRVLDVVAGLGDRDTVLFLISGGGSALVELPAPGVELGDIVETYDLLMRAGVGIDEMNTVRTHLSALKGGRLAAATRARLLTVLVSDVPRGEASSVASGPTVPCRTTPADALDVLESHGLADRVPASVRRQLSSAAAPPSIVGRHLLAADGPMAGRAAVDHALAAGIPARLSEVALHGAAADTARGALATANPGEITAFVGETTVEVRGGGTGGRNQEAALAAALDMVGSPDLFVTFATDGIDGPTDAAGALVGGATLGLVEAAGIDPVLALATNDSYPALAKANCLIRCGPTGTNVADIWLVDRRHL